MVVAEAFGRICFFRTGCSSSLSSVEWTSSAAESCRSYCFRFCIGQAKRLVATPSVFRFWFGPWPARDAPALPAQLFAPDGEERVLRCGLSGGLYREKFVFWTSFGAALCSPSTTSLSRPGFGAFEKALLPVAFGIFFFFEYWIGQYSLVSSPLPLEPRG